MRSGLVSVSFRKLSVLEIVRLASEAGLECVEWGGDIHVPHGNLIAAREAAKLTADHGLSVSSYGSYLRLGAGGEPGLESVVETAVVLGAPTIRVWAGKKSSAEATAEDRATVVEAAFAAAELASASGLSISYEFHANTLTDTAESAAELLADTLHDAIHSFWQPPNGANVDKALVSLEVALPRLSNVHAFHWWPDPATRLPLADGHARWSKYLNRIRLAGLQPDVLLEFLPRDDPSLLSAEAATLLGLLSP
ncbi:MAG: TIM barrel protein [Terrimicrobiaceae bacterium]